MSSVYNPLTNISNEEGCLQSLEDMFLRTASSMSVVNKWPYRSWHCKFPYLNCQTHQFEQLTS